MKKILTSGLIFGLAISTAIADDVLYNQTISESCKVDFLGSSNGNAVNSFEAQYSRNLYDITAGQYLPKNETEGVTCPANSFCIGGTAIPFSETVDQGITGCPSGFGLSSAGSDSQSDCYRTCTTNDVAHSASVSGGYYYGNNNQCSVVSCVTGYHKSLDIAHNMLLHLLMDLRNLTAEEVAEQYPTDADMLAYAEINNWFDNAKLYTCAPSADAYLKSIKPNADIYEKGNSANRKYKSASGTGSNRMESDLENGEWELSFSYGSIKGMSKCTATNGENLGAQGNPDAITSGEAKYCWCHANSLDGSPLVSYWVFNLDRGSASDCADYCAFRCANSVNESIATGVRGALFGFADAKEVCVANTITVTWDPNNGQAASTNQCTYDGDITLPTAPEKTGYTFSGWKLVTGSTQARCELITDNDECNATPGCGHDTNNGNGCRYIVDDCSSITDENQCLHGANNNACHYCGWKDGRCVKSSGWPC